jgi:hypothetical protein
MRLSSEFYQYGIEMGALLDPGFIRPQHYNFRGHFKDQNAKLQIQNQV